jgi:hypothetical protein
MVTPSISGYAFNPTNQNVIISGGGVTGINFISQLVACAYGCPVVWVGDSECDYYCDVAACSYDAGDCGIPSCAQGCPDSWIGDGYCDPECNFTACSYDGGDC